MDAVFKYLLVLISVSSIVVQLDAVKINPSLCPTNKIAPHRRHVSREQGNPRTLGLIYELLVPRRPPVYQIEPINDLEEQPQEDDPDDCGEIEDYDETDLSSVTPGAQNRPYKPYRENRHLFGEDYGWSPYYPVTGKPPTKPYRPHRTTRRPYYQETLYGSNGYRPPSHYYPSDYIKPVKEDVLDSPQAAYRPSLIGGILAHVVGYPPIRPTTETVPHRNSNSPFRFPESDHYTNRRRQKKSQHINRSSSIIGSFVDLLFK